MTSDKISITLDPVEHARNAYSAGYFVEAIQIIHGFVELQARELLMLNRSSKGAHEYFDIAYDSMFDISLNVAIKVLFIQKVISKEERDKLMFFNKTRNNLIHRIYTDDRVGQNSGFPKSEYDKGFDDRVELINILNEKLHADVKT